MRHTARLLAVFAVGVFMLSGMAGSAVAGINQWTTNGPYGGDISASAISPNFATDQTVYAGTGGGGGVFKSTNGGTTWTATNTGITSVYVYSLAVSPNYATDRTVFAGTYGGVFKSTNCGATWAAVNTGITNLVVYSLAISPNYALDQTVYAGTGGGGVFKSTDGGANWTAVNSGITTTPIVICSLAVSPNYTTDQTVYAGTWYGVFKSTNGGASWTAVNTGLAGLVVFSLAVSPNYAPDQTVYAGTYSGVFKSANGGTSWAAVNTGITADINGYFNIYSLAISPNYASDHTVYGGNSTGVFKSTNSGTGWTAVNTGIADLKLRYLALSPNYATDHTIYVATAFSGVFKSTNGGASWADVNMGLTDLRIYSLAVSPNYATDHTVYAGTVYGGVFKTTDSGASWAAVNIDLTGWCIYSLAVSPNYASDQTVYAGAGVGASMPMPGGTSGVFKTTDGGTSWVATNTGITDVNVRYLALSPNYASDLTIYAGTSYGGVFKSTNGGASWTAVNTGITANELGNIDIYSIAVSPNYATDQTIYAGTWDAGVCKSMDGGANWGIVLNTGIKANGFVDKGIEHLSLAISPNYASDHTVCVGTWGFGVLKTTDGGASWSDENPGITSAVIYSLAISPDYAFDQTVYAGTAGGVFICTFLDTTPPTSTITAPGNGATLYGTFCTITGMATASNGVAFVDISTDNGTTWHAAAGTTSWSYAWTLPANGTFTIKSKATDSLNNIETPGAGITVTVNAPVSMTSLNPTLPTPCTTGNMVEWFATATGGSGSYQFKFLLRDPAGTWSTVKDYAVPGNIWNWTPALPGKYQVVCYVRNAGSTAAYEAYLNSGWYTVNWTPAQMATLTPDVASPALINFGMGSTLVTWTATATGGSGSYEFKFMLRNPAGVWSTVKDYTVPGNTWDWTPSITGKYQVVCYVRNAGSTASYDAYLNSGWYTVNWTPAQMATLAPDVVSPALINFGMGSTLVTWTATATGGSGSYEFKFLLRNPAGAWSTVKDYAIPGNTFSWVPSVVGKYQVVCYVRNAGSTAAYEGYINFGWYEVKYGKAQLASFNPSPPSPSIAGNMVTWTATGSGGSGSYEYKILLRNTLGVWTTVKDYGVPGNTWDWTPAIAGKYQVVCYVRNAGSTIAYDAYINSGWYTVK